MVVLALSGCAGQSAGSGTIPAATSAVSAPATGQVRQPAGHHRRTRRHRHPAGSHPLRAVHDPGQVTGTLTGPCHTRDGGRLPDPHCTPGAFDPAVTQANIQSTICRSGYTETVRPPETQTETFKWNVAEPAYGQHDVSGELDHLVPLELGGANDASNLWVEAGSIPNPKDTVENALNQAVCDGRISLRAAQRAIARDWLTVAAAQGISVPAAGGAAAPPSSGGSGGWCSATASYSSRYGDWDVQVRSSQPDATVTASGGGYSHSWHTDSGGSADVYLRGPSPGQKISVTVGRARCSTTAR